MATWRERLSEWGIEVGQKIIWSLDKWYAHKSKVGDRAFFDNRDFAWVPRIEADWRKVRTDLERRLARPPRFGTGALINRSDP